MNRKSGTIFRAAIILAVAVPLFAHMHIEKTEPAAESTVAVPPTVVQVWFNQTPDIKISKMTLTGPMGPVELEAVKVVGKSLSAVIKGALKNGTYTAEWQSAGDDGHLQKAQFKFTLKRSL